MNQGAPALSEDEPANQIGRYVQETARLGHSMASPFEAKTQGRGEDVNHEFRANTAEHAEIASFLVKVSPGGTYARGHVMRCCSRC